MMTRSENTRESSGKMGKRVLGKEKRENKNAILVGSAVALLILIIGAWSLIAGRFILLPGVKIVLNGEKSMQVEVLSDYTDAGATAHKGKQDYSDKLVADGTVDTKKIGEYTITYSVVDGKHTYTAQRIVNVVDTTPPELTLQGEAKMTVSKRELYEEPGYTAKDAYDGELTDKVTVEEKQAGDVCTLTYTVKDLSGNEAMAERTLTIKDIVAPVITLKGNESEYLSKGDTFTDAGYTALDDLDGDLTDSVTVSGSVDTDTVGSYTLTYTVTDKAGNTGKAERVVSVYGNNEGSVKRLYLTFDDGPSSEVTPRVLDILKKHNAKATFFILNYSDSNKEIIRRAINEGHTIAIHGYSHDYATIYASDEAFMQNIYKLHDKLMADFGYDAKLIRFPGGSSNTVSCSYNDGIMSRLAVRVEKEGFAYFDWNISSGDAGGNNIDRNKIYNNVTQHLFGEGNNVVLMHDTNYKETTADALEDIIIYAKTNGYTLLPLTPDTRPCHHGIAN